MVSNIIAVSCMLKKNNIKNDNDFIKNLDKYQSMYEEAMILHSKNKQGKPSWNKGLKYKRKTPCSAETRKKISQKNSGRLSNRIRMYNGDDEKIVKKEDVEKMLLEGYKFGRSESVRKKFSDVNKENPSLGMLNKKQSDYQKQKVSEALKGKPKNITARKNMSKARKGKILVSNNNLDDSKYIDKNELQYYINLGYYKGRLHSK